MIEFFKVKKLCVFASACLASCVLASTIDSSRPMSDTLNTGDRVNPSCSSSAPQDGHKAIAEMEYAIQGFVYADPQVRDQEFIESIARQMVVESQCALNAILDGDRRPLEREKLLKEWGSVWGKQMVDPEHRKMWIRNTNLLRPMTFGSNASSSPKTYSAPGAPSTPGHLVTPRHLVTPGLTPTARLEPSEGGIHLYYVNGIGGSLLQAVKNKTILERALLKSSKSPKVQTAKYSIAFNPSNDLLVDVLQAASQVSLELTAKELGSLLNPFGDFVKDVIEKVDNLALKKKLEKFYKKVKEKIKAQRAIWDDLSASDLKKHVDAYSKDLSKGKKVILVGHSQGVLYANAAVQQIKDTGAASPRDIAIYAVSSPTSSLADGSKTYLTHDADLIQYLPGALKPNFKLLDHDKKRPDLALDKLHYFSTYLSQRYNARKRLLADVIKKMAAI